MTMRRFTLRWSEAVEYTTDIEVDIPDDADATAEAQLLLEAVKPSSKIVPAATARAGVDRGKTTPIAVHVTLHEWQRTEG